MNPNTHLVETSETLAVLSTTCVECHSHGFSLTVERDAFERWLLTPDHRNLVTNVTQNIFPNVSAEDRELFFISGVCGACWDILFPDFD